MDAPIIAIAALIFGLILEVSAYNLHRQQRPRGEILPLALIGGIFLLVGLFRLLL
ncbi:hypothetical protein [Thiohalorhabdus denitrificans]|uniref:Uncharacterized protein n=1 Tax=Thiohalorhabdus denitrificans TaxID=381306 RepID=A0A1G5DQW5_9GAMM|nr:hypothetical protein [Thiohalorhabdus denitrificans]SCY17085.1 hypothetical protein SAMN05661077_1426 [Thiohalorhabdus denitrificans]